MCKFEREAIFLEELSLLAINIDLIKFKIFEHQKFKFLKILCLALTKESPSSPKNQKLIKLIQKLIQLYYSS